MIITLIIVAVVVLSIIGLIIYEINKYSDFPDAVGFISVICLILGGIALAISTGTIINSRVDADLKVEEMKERREAIVYRLEKQSQSSDNSIITNGGVYDDVVSFNAEIRSAEKWEDNPWVSWFRTPGIKDIEEIDWEQYKK